MSKNKVIATIFSNICKGVPILVYGCFNIETFYSTAEKGITVSTIILVGALLCYFKDAFKTGILTPSAFKYCTILGVFSLIFILLGNRIFEVTSILLASFLAAVPFDVGRKNINENAVDDKTLIKLKEFLNNK